MVLSWKEISVLEDKTMTITGIFPNMTNASKEGRLRNLTLHI